MSRGVSGQLSHAKTQRLLQLLVDEVPAFRRSAGIDVDTCVLHAHMTVEMIRVAGGRARPFPVKVQAWSPELARRVRAGELAPASEEDERYAEWIEAGAVGVALGFGGAGGGPVPADRYDGHLVALVAERYLVDLTADQVTARQPLVVMTPFWSAVPRDFIRGEGAVLFGGEDGSLATYHPNPECRDYLRPQGKDSTWRNEEKTARQLLHAIGWRG